MNCLVIDLNGLNVADSSQLGVFLRFDREENMGTFLNVTCERTNERVKLLSLFCHLLHQKTEQIVMSLSF